MPVITDIPKDPNCLHCELSPIIERFRLEHPDQTDAKQISEVAQVLGELIASSVVASGHVDCLNQVVSGALHVAIRSAMDLVRTLTQEKSACD
jgi:hypothetical protein